MDHSSLSYKGRGVYACSCGKEFDTNVPSPIPVGEGDAAITALKDQWRAHQKESN